MGKRKLASIQYVHNITPIEGAEKIECVHVLGWQCVANKGQFSIGDKCIYMEVDSFLPVCERFEFLRASSFKENEIMGAGFRLKTMKFRGQISQGLVQPLEILPEGKYEIGDDVTELLGIRKWEIEERVSNDGTVIAEFPSEISKTDELRVQSYPELIEEFKSVKGYYISTKMDGCSVTMYKSGDHFGVCGRNYEYADDDKCDMWKYAHEHRIEERLKENNLDDIAIQGEFCGPGIQKNRLNLKTPEWYVFTVTDMKTNTRLSMYKTEEICKLRGLNMVPVEEVEEEFKYKNVDELLERAKGKYASGRTKEGINNDYLLKE